MRQMVPIVRKFVPEQILFNVFLRPLIEIAEQYVGENPFFTESNTPMDPFYNPNRPLTSVNFEEAVNTILHCLEITPELIYICRQPLSPTTISALQGYNQVRTEYLFMESMTDVDTKYGDYVMEVTENNESVYVDYQGNVVSILCGITDKQSLYWNILVFLYVREFIHSFSLLTDIIAMTNNGEYTVLVPEHIDAAEHVAFTPEFNYGKLKGIKKMLPMASIYNGLHTVVYTPATYSINQTNERTEW